jgi:hypothetical protein
MEEIVNAMPKFAQGFLTLLHSLGVPMEAKLPQPGSSESAEANRVFLEAEASVVERAAAAWTEFAVRLRQGEDYSQLRMEVAWAAGKLSPDLALDYLACDAHVFSGNNVDIFATCPTNLVLDPENSYSAPVAFLGPGEVDLMIASLRSHWPKVQVMDEAGLQRLIEFRDRCAADAGLRVAYHADC